jgi:hypothetical protein
MKSFEKIWQDFVSKPFPEGCRGVEVEGIELYSLETFAAGCIDTFIRNGDIDSERITALRRCAEEIEVVVPRLEGEAEEYFGQLELLSREVLRLAS